MSQRRIHKFSLLEIIGLTRCTGLTTLRVVAPQRTSPRGLFTMMSFILLAIVACLWGCVLSGIGRANTIITTPAGLQPGDHFFVVFVDSHVQLATSTNITDYNAAIQADASGILYPGGTISAWHIIGSTEATNAATPLLTDTTSPVFGTNNQEISVSGWSLLGAAISLDQNGNSAVGHVLGAGSGLTSTGDTAAGFALGDSPFIFGHPRVTLNNGGLDANAPISNSSGVGYYGFAKLTVGPTSAAPEPASLALLGIGAVGLLGYGWRQRRRVLPLATALNSLAAAAIGSVVQLSASGAGHGLQGPSCLRL
jgi:hypothetical protein